MLPNSILPELQRLSETKQSISDLFLPRIIQEMEALLPIAAAAHEAINSGEWGETGSTIPGQSGTHIKVWKVDAKALSEALEALGFNPQHAAESFSQRKERLATKVTDPEIARRQAEKSVAALNKARKKGPDELKRIVNKRRGEGDVAEASPRVKGPKS